MEALWLYSCLEHFIIVGRQFHRDYAEVGQLPVRSINLRHLCCQSNEGTSLCSFLECLIKMRSPCHFRVGLQLSQRDTWSLSRFGVLRPTVCGSLICTLLTLSFWDPEKKWPEREETCLTNGAILLTVILSQTLLFLIRLSKPLLHRAPTHSQDNLKCSSQFSTTVFYIVFLSPTFMFLRFFLFILFSHG